MVVAMEVAGVAMVAAMAVAAMEVGMVEVGMAAVPRWRRLHLHTGDLGGGDGGEVVFEFEVVELAAPSLVTSLVGLVTVTLEDAASTWRWSWRLLVALVDETPIDAKQVRKAGLQVGLVETGNG